MFVPRFCVRVLSFRSFSRIRAVTLALIIVVLLATALSLSAQTGGGITIPASGTVGVGAPYPSAVTLSGLSGAITDVDITLTGLSHTFPDDLDVLLVSPQGTTAALLLDACGGPDLVNVTFTFDDSAAATLANNGPCASGTVQVSQFGPPAFTSPAPASPYGSSLSVFNGENPNGDWSLYVYDDLPSDAGSLSSWTLSVTTAGAAPPSAPAVAPTLPPPPEVPLCTDHNFSEGGVVRIGLSDALRSAVNCRVLYQNGSSSTWLGFALYGEANLGVEGLTALGVLQAVDIFSPAGLTYFEGGGVFCLRGEGTLIWLASSQCPRHPEIIGSYTVPEFEGFTCATLFEPGTLVLVEHNPFEG